MKVHYPEIVSRDVEAVCKADETVHSVSFDEPDDLLGGARTCTLAAMPPTEMSGMGKFAICILGSVDHGLWQR